MTKKIILLCWAICLSLNGNFFAAAPAGVNTTTNNHPELLCELPGPSMVMIIGATQHTLTASWPHVTGAARYKITAKDLNTNIVVYSAIMIANPATPAHHVITGLNADTPYEVGVSASSCPSGNNFGTPTLALGRTDTVIIGDVVFNNSCSPSGNSILPSTGGTIEVTMPIDPNGSGNLYSHSGLSAYGTLGSLGNWSLLLNIAVANCGSDRIKWIYEESNVNGGLVFEEQQTSRQLIVRKSGYNVLRISGIQLDAQGANMVFNVSVENSSSVSAYFDICNHTTLSRNPCTNGSQGKNAGPGNNGEVQIEIESRSDLSDELPTEETIKATPNPFNDFTNVQYQVSKQSPVSMVLFNTMGQVQRELLNDSNVAPGTYTLPVDMADLAPGVYFLTIQTESGRKITTVVKQ